MVGEAEKENGWVDLIWYLPRDWNWPGQKQKQVKWLESEDEETNGVWVTEE